MPIIELRTFGTLDLFRSDGGASLSILGQPKRLALLAYLALARPRGPQRRDTLVAMFWPELDERSARNALSQALHVLRRSLGEGVLTGAGQQEVGVDPEALSSDVARFEEAFESGEPALAFDLYRGALMPGLHVSDSPGFADWLDLERARLRRMARDAARNAAAAGEEREGVAAAAAILHRAVDLFPEDEDLLHRLVRLLGASGDRVGVRRAFERFRRRLDEEFGMEPDAETVALVERTAGEPGGRAEATGAGARGRAIRAVAVLPLLGLTTETGVYSADGMTEALITEMGRIRSLRVISHQSVLRFKGSRQPLREIASALGVDALVEGSVMSAGGRVRVTAQLVRADPEEHVWADALEAEAGDVVGVHRDVARAIARSVSAAVSSDEERRLTAPQRIDPAAYEAYLRGWMKHATVNPHEMAEAIGLYHEAISRDPSFAPPRANLVPMYFGLLATGEMSLAQALPAMSAAAEAALELDPTEGRSYIARGFVRMATHDWRGAEADLARGAALAPNLAQAHTHVALFMTGMGRFDEAIAAAEQSRWLDPLAPFAHWVGGWTLHYARRPAEAVTKLDDALRLFPDYPMAWVFLATSHFRLGDRAAAAYACRRCLELMGGNPMTLAYVTHILGMSGDRAEAEKALARFEEESAERGFTHAHYAASALCGVGRRREALDQIDRIEGPASALGWLLRVDPMLDPIRDDPRFEAALRRVGL